jgi:pimeloyl-ACP methyl ester carboxylesterase
MPKVKANGIEINYEKTGQGEPLIMIPFLSADNACYAFQIPEYSKSFECISIDPRGVGETDKPEGTYSIELFADDVAALMDALGIERAHVMGVSLGAATGLWLAAKYPRKVKSLSSHSGWTKTDPFLKVVVEGWRVTAQALGNVAEAVILGVFPWCFTPGLYATRPDYIQALSDFVSGRPVQPVEAFLRQSDAVLAHDCESVLGDITAPTLITFGEYDMVTSTRFADRMTSGIRNSELLVFKNCAHAALYESTDEFNRKTLDFLMRHSG